MNPLAAKVCADCGLLVIVTPASMDLICNALKAMPKRSVVDAVLGERSGCLVVGSKEDSILARKRLGIAPDAGGYSVERTLSIRLEERPDEDENDHDEERLDRCACPYCDCLNRTAFGICDSCRGGGHQG